MSLIEHIFEPTTLILTWQQPPAAGLRSRRKVAEITRSGEAVSLTYLSDSKDFREAIAEGFKGFPAFSIVSDIHTQGILEAFVRRLPPKKRDDYPLFLDWHYLPRSFDGSDFALLGLTGARLPSDSFELFPDLDNAAAPLDILLEVAGFRHHAEVKDVSCGDEVTFCAEPNNEHDSSAISMIVRGKKIGHISRALSSSFSKLLERSNLKGQIVRINGKPERPSVFVIAKYR